MRIRFWSRIPCKVVTYYNVGVLEPKRFHGKLDLMGHLLSLTGGKGECNEECKQRRDPCTGCIIPLGVHLLDSIKVIGCSSMLSN
jgi:hypothetical protein